jgi:sulfide:quinone oxidoreductase
LTGSPEKPIEVNPGASELCRLVDPLWRLDKRLLRICLPWRFAAGDPFHAGLSWKG